MKKLFCFRPKVGDTLSITAESNGLIQSLSVAIIGLNGLVYSENFKNLNDLSKFNFNLKITKEMAPESSIIVFYVREQDGDIVYDEFKVELELIEKNHVSKVISSYHKLINFIAAYNRKL